MLLDLLEAEIVLSVNSNEKSKQFSITVESNTLDSICFDVPTGKPWN